MKTGFTFRGKDIVLSKTMGRPLQGLAKKGLAKGIYPDSKFIQVVTLYAALGQIPKVAELSGVPESRIREWRKTDKFKELLNEVRDENNSKIDAIFTQIMEKSLDQVLDRIENGDVKVDLKTGEQFRVPIGAKDLSIVTAITVDKRQVLRGLPNTRTETVISEGDKLASLAASFEKLANQKRSGITYKVEVEDVTPIDSVNVTEGVTQDDSEPQPA